MPSMNGEVSRAEEGAEVAREATEKAKEEAARLREHAISAEEVATKAREETTRYKGTATELGKEKRLMESDLAAAQSAYGRVKEALLMSEIARGAMEEAEKKAHEDLEA